MNVIVHSFPHIIVFHLVKVLLVVTWDHIRYLYLPRIKYKREIRQVASGLIFLEDQGA